MASATVTNVEPFSAQLLPGRAVVRVGGAGALAFLHNLLTCSLTSPVPAYGALLSPQGKILHDVFVVPEGPQVWLDAAADHAPLLVRSLMMYRLRAKLEVAIDESRCVGVSQRADLQGLCYSDPRTPSAGFRSISPQGFATISTGYEAARLALGLGDSVADIGSGLLFPHEANLDQLNGVSFSKGCYVGQEVVSRMHHRHSARNRLLPVRLGAKVEPGTEILSGEVRIGDMMSNSHGYGLALLRLDRLAEAGAPLLAAGVRVHVQKPLWGNLAFSIPDVAA